MRPNGPRRAFWLLALASAAAACNALNGSHDRFGESEDASKPMNPRVDGGADVQGVDGGDASTGDAEAGVLEIQFGKTFMTLNGATFVTTAGGTTITATDGGPTAAHGVIVPVTQPAIPGDEFTVHATILAPSDMEFGLLTRLQPGNGNDRAVVFGSKLGAASQPFISTFGPPDWEPVQPPPGRGAPYTYGSGARYNFKVKCNGDKTTAKMWDATTAEPGDFTAATLDGGAVPTGRGIGFYVFAFHNVGTDGTITNAPVLESLRVTVP